MTLPAELVAALIFIHMDIILFLFLIRFSGFSQLWVEAIWTGLAAPVQTVLVLLATLAVGLREALFGWSLLRHVEGFVLLVAGQEMERRRQTQTTSSPEHCRKKEDAHSIGHICKRQMKGGVGLGLYCTSLVEASVHDAVFDLHVAGKVALQGKFAGAVEAFERLAVRVQVHVTHQIVHSVKLLPTELKINK